MPRRKGKQSEKEKGDDAEATTGYEIYAMVKVSCSTGLTYVLLYSRRHMLLLTYFSFSLLLRPVERRLGTIRLLVNVAQAFSSFYNIPSVPDYTYYGEVTCRRLLLYLPAGLNYHATGGVQR